MGGVLGMQTQHRDTAVSDSDLTGSVVNAHFRVLEDGRKIFYPLGIFGRRGFVVSSTEQESLLRVRAHGVRRAGGLFILLNFLGLIAIGILFDLSQRFALWLYCGYVLALLAGLCMHLTHRFRSITNMMRSFSVRNSPIVYWRSEGQDLTRFQLVLRGVTIVGTAGGAITLAMYLGRPSWLVYGSYMALWSIPYLFMAQGWLRGRSTR